MATFISNFDIIIQEAKNRKAVALSVLGGQAEAFAKEETPVDTGNLRNSMTHTEEESKTIVGTAVDYGVYVEFGSRGGAGKKMLTKALSTHDEYYKKVVDAIYRGT